MHVDIRIACSPNEFRRLCGSPELLPLFELAQTAFARWLQARVLAADWDRCGSPPGEGEGEGGSDPDNGRRG